MKILIFLSVLLTLGNCKWATPIEVTSFLDPTRISDRLYTDSSSGVSHIVYCNSSDGLPYYAYLDNSGLFLNGPNPLTQTLRCYQVEVSGPNDGLHVYIAMEARRSMSIEECNENSLDSCDDLYIFESEDGGETWLPPKNVGGIPGDAIRRRTFKLLTNWNAHYIWLVYNQYIDINTHITTVRYDTKKHEFELEKILVENFGEMNHYALITHDESGKTTLSLFYTTPYSLSVFVKVSKDEGQTWVDGNKISRLCTDKKMVYKTVVSDGKYIMIGCAKGDDIYFEFSDDLGKTWTEPSQFPSRGIEDVTFCTPPDPLGVESDIMVLYSEGRDIKVGYSKVPISKYNIAYIPEQFYYAAARMGISCYFAEDKLKMRFMYQIRSPHDGGSKYTLYISDNDDLEEALKENKTSEVPKTNPREDL